MATPSVLLLLFLLAMATPSFLLLLFLLAMATPSFLLLLFLLLRCPFFSHISPATMVK